MTSLVVTLPTVIAAGVCMVASIITWVMANAKQAPLYSVIVYLSLLASATLLIYSTGGLSSPFVFIWALVSVGAALYGVWGLGPALFIACGYLAMLFINKEVTTANLLPAALTLGGSIASGVILWSRAQPFTGRRERDPADYKQRSEELTSLVEESEVVINAIGDGVLAVDHQGVVQLINPAAQALLGWSKQDALSLQYQSVLKLTDEQDKELPDAVEPIKQALNMNQEVRSNTLQLETKSGKKLFVSLVASPLGDAGSGVIAVVRDITKERAEEREQAEFISTASHEMRTPVASIEGYLGLALNPNTATIDEKARDFITKAHESAQHLGRLFQDLLDVSKSEDGRLSNEPVVLDIVAFAGEVVEGLHQKASDKGLILTYKPGYNNGGGEKGERRLSPVYYVNLDKDHVREVINNLTENAIKYTLNGEVSIDIVGDAEHITISVADSGIGIPAEDLPHLFQKFYRVDNSDTREIGGTGLGLYLCRRLVETLGGRIWAESVYKQGSTFFVELPRIDTQEAQRLLAVQAQQNNQPSNVQTEEFTAATSFSGPAAQPQPTQQPAPTPVAPVAQPSAPEPQPVAVAPQYTQPAPVATPIPQQPQPSPAPVAPVAPPAPMAPPERLNIPLAHIEQNPGIFMQQRSTPIAVPPRNQDNQSN